MTETVLSLLSAVVRRMPDRPAIISRHAMWSFRALEGHVARQAAGIRLDMPPGAVPIPYPSNADFLSTFFAAAAVGRPAFTGGPLPYLSVMSAAAEPGDLFWGATSGSMGEAKVYARSHASWIESFRACEAVFPFEDGDAVLIPGPLTHSLFLYAALHALTRGIPLVLAGRFSPKTVLHLMRRHPAAVMYAVPAILSSLLRAGLDIPPLRMIFAGGDRLSPALRAALHERMPGTEIVEFYGASETSFISYKSTSHPAPEGSAGRLFPGVQAEIRSRSGETLLPGQTGMITVSSPMVFSRYIGEAAAGPWVTAGDLGVMDGAGFLYLVGRADREVNSKGAKISPERVEAVLSSHTGIGDAAVIGVADEHRGQRLVAAIEFSGDPLERAALSAFCRDHLPDAHCPQTYYVTSALPRTRSGKIALAALKRDIEAGSPEYRPLT